MELRGADFDWDNWAGLPAAELAAQRAATAALLRDEGRPSMFTRMESCVGRAFGMSKKTEAKPEQGALAPARCIP